MNQEERRQLEQALDFFLDEGLARLLLSSPATAEEGAPAKVKIRPVALKGTLLFQAEEQVGKQAFHKNMDKEETKEYLINAMEHSFRQAQIDSEKGTGVVLVSKKGKMTVKVKKNPNAARIRPVNRSMEHNRKKHYILEEGRPVPFLIDLGVMTQEGKIVKSYYDKYRQINRFLEFIEDILPNLNKEEETTIIDFGCGKSYLTFAMYHYLKELKGYPVHIIGLDLKTEVIEHCSRLAKQYGYEKLEFFHGDIASYQGVTHVDMVVTLHACDTATDYAMEKAVNWGAKVILSVPCCQHELNRQMENPLMKPVFSYGLIKERMAALYTDAIRAQVLEYKGYRTQILEFIDMEHTPKNILIRAVRQEKGKKNAEELKALLQFLHIRPALVKLLAPELLDPVKQTAASES